jgi:Flp pilus assembly protein TadG
MVMFAITLPVLMLILAFVVDLSNWMYTRTVLQNGADTAVMGAAKAYAVATTLNDPQINPTTEATNRAAALYQQHAKQLNITIPPPTINITAGAVHLETVVSAIGYLGGITHITTINLNIVADARAVPA